MLSLLVISIANAQTYTASPGIDYQNNDLDYKPNFDKASCENLCNADFRCAVYTISTNDAVTNCWIKSKVVNQEANVNRTSYIKVNPGDQPAATSPPAVVIPLPVESLAPSSSNLPAPVIASPSLSPEITPNTTPRPFVPTESPSIISVVDNAAVASPSPDILVQTKPKFVIKKATPIEKPKPKPAPPTTTYKSSESNSGSSISQSTLVYIYSSIGIVLLFSLCIFIVKYRNRTTKSISFDSISLGTNRFDSAGPISYLKLPRFHRSTISSKSSIPRSTVYFANKSLNPSPMFRIPETPSSISIESSESSDQSRITSFQDRTTICQSQFTQDSFISFNSDFADSSVSSAPSYSTDTNSCRSSKAFLQSTFTIKSVMIEKYKSMMTSIYSESDMDSVTGK